MATTKVVDVIARATTLLQDTTNTRWTKEELLNWFNDAQLAIVNRRPDTHVKNEEFQCIKGTKQTIPNDGLRLMHVVRNKGGVAIRPIDMRVLDDQLPMWHEEVDSSYVEHYAYDLADPKTFYVYPAPAANVAIDIVYTVAPEQITINDFKTDTKTITLDDSYLNPIIDWMLYRAYSKDADYAANAQRAQMHFDSFRVSIGEKTDADIATGRTTAVDMNTARTNFA